MAGVLTTSRVADSSSPLRKQGIAEGTRTRAGEADGSHEWLRE